MSFFLKIRSDLLVARPGIDDLYPARAAAS
jgi:hypothetical protein